MLRHIVFSTYCLQLVCSTELGHSYFYDGRASTNSPNTLLIILSLLSLQVMNFLKNMAGNEYVGFSNAT